VFKKYIPVGLCYVVGENLHTVYASGSLHLCKHFAVTVVMCHIWNCSVCSSSNEAVCVLGFIWNHVMHQLGSLEEFSGESDEEVLHRGVVERPRTALAVCRFTADKLDKRSVSYACTVFLDMMVTAWWSSLYTTAL